MADPQLVLKTTPPRAHRATLTRERLARLWADVRDRTAIAVIAPRGFGKTTLLVQWRRLWLEQGALVAWVTVDAQDEPARLAAALLHAMRVASGRTAFDRIALQFAGRADRELDSLTGLLSEIASLATPTVLMLDDVERMPEATVRESLAYLLYNAPPNLHVVVGSRAPLAVPTWELAAHGDLAVVKAGDLRFELDESIAVLDKRFGGRLALDDCVRLHEAAEGWPIGLQLAAASIERADDLHAAVATLSARHGDIERYFLESLLARLDAPVAAFLTRIAILDGIEPELCEAVTGCGSAAAYIDRLARDTPILIVAELRDWIRLHPLARDFLLGRFEQLPLSEQQSLHRRAAEWYLAHGRYHHAGRHALAAGDEAMAQTCAERCLLDLARQGKLAEAHEWLERIPKEAIARDVELRMVAGWVMALGDRPAQALEVARELARDPGAPPPAQFEAALIGACAAAFADVPGVAATMLARWREPPARLKDPIHAVAYANNRALLALYAGDTDEVRRLEAHLPARLENKSLLIALAFGRTIVGLSHLWDGNAYKAEAALRASLVDAERDAGRRSALAGILAPVMAAALFDRNQPAAARALLADRLDVIERSAVPDGVLHAYRTLARIAAGSGDERHALDVLDNLIALGETRRMPRLKVAGLAEQIRIHAMRARTETVARLTATLEDMAARFADEELLPFRPYYELTVAIARAYAAIGAHDYARAEATLKTADALAAGLRRGRDALIVKVLRAVVARERGSSQALPLLAEAQSLAAIGGNERLLVDTHPIAAQMVAELDKAASGAGPATPARIDDERPRAAALRPAAVPLAGMLTPKEAEVLSLLDNGMSNKLIARTMGISDETVKWHLKNLFSKLSAGTRRHAVDRARLLGLLAA
jgi:LuxR family maltose regulon positive regulatory protein